MSWKPTTDFEEEIVDLQPDHNFIFGNLTDSTPEVFYPRPKAHLEYAALQKQQKSEREKTLTPSQNHKLNVIAKVQRIAGTKPLGEQPTIDDWNDDEHVEQETVAMMRHFGFGPSIEEPLDEARTIATYPIRDEMKIMQNGTKRMPIFLDEKFFKLKPRTSNKDSPVDSTLSEENSSSKSSESRMRAQSENSKYESALADNYTDTAANDDSFASAHNNDNDIRSEQWRSKKHNPQVFDNYSHSDIKANGTTSNTYHQQDKQVRQNQKFYTAKELYEKKRYQ